MAIPTQAAVLAAWRDRLMAGPIYAKVARMHIRRVDEAGSLATVLQGKVETTNSYAAGDYIVHGTEGERYVLTPATFEARYHTDTAVDTADPALAADGYRLYMPKGRVWAEQIADAAMLASTFPAGKFIAPWGNEMAMEVGDWVASPYPAANQVYRIEKIAFANTYSLVKDDGSAVDVAPAATPAPAAPAAAAGNGENTKGQCRCSVS